MKGQILNLIINKNSCAMQICRRTFQIDYVQHEPRTTTFPVFHSIVQQVPTF